MRFFVAELDQTMQRVLPAESLAANRNNRLWHWWARRLRLPLIAMLLCLVCPKGVSAVAWKFLVYGDSRSSLPYFAESGVNTAILSELAARTVTENPALVLFPGDTAYTSFLGYNAPYTTWKSAMQPVYNAGIGVCVVAGNHECDGGGQAGLDAFKSKFIAPLQTTAFAGEENFVLDNSSADGRSYAFNYRNALFVGLDNYPNASSSAHRVNQTFLSAQFAARNPNTTPLVFTLGHEPAFCAGEDVGLEQTPTQRNIFWQSLENAGCRQYFCGHMHLYADAQLKQTGESSDNPQNDVHQVIVGTGGAPLYDLVYQGNMGSWTLADLSHDASSASGHYGYVRVVVDDAAHTVTQTWVQRTGTNTFVDVPSSVFSYMYTVPEPSTAAMATIAAGLLAMWRTGRRRAMWVPPAGRD
jgi:hypothetical protein